MAIDIKQPPKSGGLMGSKAFRVTAGTLTGGPGGAAMALAGDSAGGRAIGTYNSFKSQPAQEPQQQQDNPFIMTKQSEEMPDTPMQRRYQSLQTDPASSVENGLAALRDPSVPDHVRQQYAEPLLRAKYYGRSSGGIA